MLQPTEGRITDRWLANSSNRWAKLYRLTSSYSVNEAPAGGWGLVELQYNALLGQPQLSFPSQINIGATPGGAPSTQSIRIANVGMADLQEFKASIQLLPAELRS